MPCEHRQFASSVTVTRITDRGAFTADVLVWCEECGADFVFLGLTAGIAEARPTVSARGEELRAPIAPVDEVECYADGDGRLAYRRRAVAPLRVLPGGDLP